MTLESCGDKGGIVEVVVLRAVTIAEAPNRQGKMESVKLAQSG